MRLDKVPVAVLLALGFANAARAETTTGSSGGSSSSGGEAEATGGPSSTSSSSSDGGSTTGQPMTTGPCLLPPLDSSSGSSSTGEEFTQGPCLSIAGPGSDDGCACDATPDDGHPLALGLPLLLLARRRERSAVIDRVADALPPDVAKRLRDDHSHS